MRKIYRVVLLTMSLILFLMYVPLTPVNIAAFVAGSSIGFGVASILIIVITEVLYSNGRDRTELVAAACITGAILTMMYILREIVKALRAEEFAALTADYAAISAVMLIIVSLINVIVSYTKQE